MDKIFVTNSVLAKVSQTIYLTRKMVKCIVKFHQYSLLISIKMVLKKIITYQLIGKFERLC